MNPQIDMLEIMALRKGAGVCLDGAFDVVTPLSPTEGFLDHVKNVQGYPIDRRRYGWDSISASFYIFDLVTEGDKPFGWKDPIYIKVNNGNDNRGNRICPRYPKALPVITYEANSPFMIINAGKWDGAPHNLGGLKYVLNVPTVMEWGGDVGTGQTYRLDYYWNGHVLPGGKDLIKLQNGTIAPGIYSDWERYWYTPPFGLVCWEHSKLVNGAFVIDDKSLSLKLQTLADWQKTYPDLKEFTYILPFLR